MTRTLRYLSALLTIGAGAMVGIWTAQSQENLLVGYATIGAAPGSPVPVATALFSYQNGAGVLVAEAGVGAVEPIRSGRVFVDGSIPTGLALANPSNSSTNIQFTLRGEDGTLLERSEIELGARQHIARFIPQILGIELAEDFIGSLTFEASQEPGLGALTIRQSTNQYQEPLFATLPIVDLDSPQVAGGFDPAGASSSTVFPHIGAGGVLSTQILLINPTAGTLGGTIELRGSDGNPLELSLDGTPGSSFSYQLEPDGVFQGVLTSDVGVFAGYALVEVNQGNGIPSGTAIFQFRNGDGSLMSEAGVGASLGTTHARIFVDTVGTQTGVALANTGDEAAEVSFTLLDRAGNVLGETGQELPAQGHVSVFVDQLFDVSPGFTGTMEIESQDPVVPISLKLTVNSRNDLILTTLPVADVTRPPTASPLILPQVGFGLGFSTRLIFINPVDEMSAVGSLNFWQSNGTPLMIPVLGETDDEFDYEIGQGSARQIRPGNTAEPAALILDVSDPMGTEIVVNEGNERMILPVVLDTEGNLRDDFPVQYLSLDEQAASIADRGQLSGNEAGFSTLTVSVGDVVKTSTITVVNFSQGAAGFAVSGISQDMSGNLFMTNPVRHTILQATSLTDPAVRYAGLDSQAGLLDAPKLSARFREPRSAQLNQVDGVLYVADSGNHVIRQVPYSAASPVETLAGSGQAGSQDGVGAAARFRNPSGLLQDGRGGLWVADTGNHTIRRIDLVSRQVTTIAGSPGNPGFQDGVGSGARFNTPTGLALIYEPLGAQLQREQIGAPPPPLRVAVVDRSNRALRFVNEDGSVETLSSETGRLPLGSAAAATSFDDPRGVVSDPLGNLYVSGGGGQVTTILSTGEMVDAAQPGTFDEPADMAITSSGRVIVAQEAGNEGPGELRYGIPEIFSLSPNEIDAGGGSQVTIQGRNFAPDSIVIVGSTAIPSPQIVSTRTIVFQAPVVPSGRTTVSVYHRGGIAQAPLFGAPPSVDELGPGEITTIVGGTTFIGDGGPATSAPIATPQMLALDSAGNLYFADSLNNRIRRVDAVTGIITTIAGNGQTDFGGEGGPALASSFRQPYAVAVDSAGNVYFSASFRLLQVEARTGLLRRIAGTGASEPRLVEGVPATDIPIGRLGGILIDEAGGGILISSSSPASIRRIDTTTNLISTVAGTGTQGFSGDSGPARDAQVEEPRGMTFDPGRNLCFIDPGRLSRRIRCIDANGLIKTFAGNGGFTGSGDGGPASAAALHSGAADIAYFDGAIYVADTSVVRRIDLSTNIIDKVAGKGNSGTGGDGGPALDAEFTGATSLTIGGSGSLYVSDMDNDRIRRIDGQTWIIDTYVGFGEQLILGDGEPAIAASLRIPGSLALDPEGNYVIADQDNDRVRQVDRTSGLITTIAGVGTSEFGEVDDGVPAIEAHIGSPNSVTFDEEGDLYIAEGHAVRRVDRQTATIEYFAGQFNLSGGGFSGDGGPATDASFRLPSGLALDSERNLYVADRGNSRIRRIDQVTGIVDTVIGNGSRGFSGDGGPASQAVVNFGSTGIRHLVGMAFDSDGNLYFTDVENRRIRRIEGGTGTVTTVAGGGNSNVSGTPALDFNLFFPEGLAFDAEGNLYIAAPFADRVYRLNVDSETIDVVAGNRTAPESPGDGGSALDSFLNFPTSLTFDSNGDLLIVDTLNSRVRVIRAPVP